MRSWLIALSLVLLLNHGTAQELRHRGAITGIVLQDGGMLVSSQSGILFHERSGIQPSRMFAAPDFRVQSIAQAPDGTLYAAGGLPGESAIVSRFTTTGSQELIASLPSRKDLAYGIAVAPNGKHVAVAHSDGSVLVAGVDTLDAGKWIQSQKHTAPALAVTYSPDGSMLASCGLDGIVLVARTAEPEQKARNLDDHTSGVECLTFSPDGRWLASGSRDARVRIHESATGRLLRTYSGLGMGHEPVAGRVVARIPSILWSTRGLFAATSKGNVYRLSETDDGRALLSYGNIGEPITALCEVDDHLVCAAAERLTTVVLHDRSPSSP